MAHPWKLQRSTCATWSKPVSLVGDAAHLVPPLGVGVDLAMLDACELALVIAHNDTVADAVRVYERTTLPRSNAWQWTLDHGAEELVSTDLPDFVDSQSP
ncbi:FAD-dependent oxidoreductase [Streptomyces xanthochromogenes]|uniref:FAD-dependent oxidoreductase n=1 Tax=Streptomyces xanthochromogenes TaxID=67384 RepID=UPI00167C093B|nr:FAD-dependent monooxygenase [Streptomyces xanthochromogenes]